MRRMLPLLATLALLAGACGGDDDATVPATGDITAPTVDDTTTTSSITTSSTTSSTTSTTGADGPEGTELAQTCQSPDGFTISYPADWEAVSDCGQFGPAPLDEPEPATDERTGVVSAFIDPVSFEQVSEPTEGDTDRRETTVAGQPAVRVQGEQSGTGLYPEGTSYVRWLVDVGDGATFFLDAYDLGYDIEFDQAVEVLDQMVQTLELGGAQQ